MGLEGGVSWLLGGAGSLQMWREAWKLSLKEVMALTHQEAELQWREELLFRAGRRRVAEALCHGTDVCLLPCFRAAVLGGQHRALLESLDNSEIHFCNAEPQPASVHLFSSHRLRALCSTFSIACSRSRKWRAGGGVWRRAGLGGALPHLHCRRAGGHGGGKRRPQERTRRQQSLELCLPAAGEGPARRGPGPGCRERALARQVSVRRCFL